ncbi:MAG: hypothetical protein H7Y86_06440 [Rhizobacter sp.]|nr:hypothetical protein [Ferruginibacter sp.]
MKKFVIAGMLLFVAALSACSKKSVPAKEETTSTEIKKPVVKAIKTPTPKSIVVNEAAAKKTVDGKYYYDLEGKRYWRSKKDGKYYLYYKGMFDNKDFQ